MPITGNTREELALSEGNCLTAPVCLTVNTQYTRPAVGPNDKETNTPNKSHSSTSTISHHLMDMYYLKHGVLCVRYNHETKIS